jgi:hypothetical protein
MLFRSVFVVLGRMQGMPVRYFGVVGGFFVIAVFGVLSGLTMMLCRMFVMVRRLLVVLVNIVLMDLLAVHCHLPVGGL